MPAPEEVRREMNANFTVFALAGLGILILTLAADWWVALGVFFLIRANNIDRDSRRKQNPIAKLAPLQRREGMNQTKEGRNTINGSRDADMIPPTT